MDNPKDERFNLKYHGKFFNSKEFDTDLYKDSYELEGIKYDEYLGRLGHLYLFYGPDKIRDYYELPRDIKIIPPTLKVFLKLKGYEI